MFPNLLQKIYKVHQPRHIMAVLAKFWSSPPIHGCYFLDFLLVLMYTIRPSAIYLKFVLVKYDKNKYLPWSQRENPTLKNVKYP